MKSTGAVYEARTYGSVRGMGREPHPTRYTAVTNSSDKKNPARAGFE